MTIDYNPIFCIEHTFWTFFLLTSKIVFVPHTIHSNTYNVLYILTILECLHNIMIYHNVQNILTGIELIL